MRGPWSVYELTDGTNQPPNEGQLVEASNRDEA